MVEEAGSGVIIEIGGKYYVLTNRHVIKNHGRTDIKIRLHDNNVLTPGQIWSDPDTDIALMLVTADDLIPARIGDSDEVEIGDAVLAHGQPVRTEPFGHLRHHQRQRAARLEARRAGREVPGLSANRCRHQSGQ